MWCAQRASNGPAEGALIGINPRRRGLYCIDEGRGALSSARVVPNCVARAVGVWIAVRAALRRRLV